MRAANHAAWSAQATGSGVCRLAARLSAGAIAHAERFSWPATADRLLAGTAGKLTRHRRGLALSAARSFLFNRVLAQRVSDASWNRAIPGDALQLSGSHSFFVAGTVDPELEQRVLSMDVHPTGPLVGSGETPVTGEARQLETGCLADQQAWCTGLAKAGLRQERRALRLPVEKLAWTWPQPDCAPVV